MLDFLNDLIDKFLSFRDEIHIFRGYPNLYKSPIFRDGR